MATPKIEIVDEKDQILVYVPITTVKKFRCKVRDNFQDYGIVHAPKSKPIPENAYMEWQIGYDKSEKDEDKETFLTNLWFQGANGVMKNPYELSELFYLLCKHNYITREEVNSLINDIEKTTTFLNEIFLIHSEIEDNVVFNNEEFYKSVIKLPTFNKKNTSSNIIIQISIEKQQYAVAVQPMLYINIPITEFENKDKLINNTSQEEKYGILRLNRNNSEFIKNAFICFGMCSDKHNHDILEILKVIRDNIWAK